MSRNRKPQPPCPYCGRTDHEPIKAPIGTLYACEEAPEDEFAMQTGGETVRVTLAGSTEGESN